MVGMVCMFCTVDISGCNFIYDPNTRNNKTITSTIINVLINPPGIHNTPGGHKL